MDTTVSRRQLLAATGVGLGIATAGCAGAGGSRTVTAQLQPTEEDLTAAQEEARQIQQQQFTGNLTRAEAQQQLSDLQSQLLDGLIEDATERAEGLGLTVEDSIEPTTLLVSGSGNSLIDFLDIEIVASFSSADRFDELQGEQPPQNASTGQQSTENTSDGS
jgi:hypothetical protein